MSAPRKGAQLGSSTGGLGAALNTAYDQLPDASLHWLEGLVAVLYEILTDPFRDFLNYILMLFCVFLNG